MYTCTVFVFCMVHVFLVHTRSYFVISFLVWWWDVDSSQQSVSISRAQPGQCLISSHLILVSHHCLSSFTVQSASVVKSEYSKPLRNGAGQCCYIKFDYCIHNYNGQYNHTIACCCSNPNLCCCDINFARFYNFVWQFWLLVHRSNQSRWDCCECFHDSLCLLLW